jgi:SAM-dependent methyltransferase
VTPLVEESLALAGAIRAERQWRARAVTFYWSTCFRLTGVVERWQGRERCAPHAVINFGCGNNFLEGAVNADLFAPHRFLLRKRRPDLYWRGSSALPDLAGRFRVVICEHVIEHLLPDDALALLRGMRHALAPDGVIVVSFPDIQTILTPSVAPTHGSPMTHANSVIYRYGHRFMYDPQLVKELLDAAGFSDVATGPRDTMPYAAMLLEARESESAYLTAQNYGAPPRETGPRPGRVQ